MRRIWLLWLTALLLAGVSAGFAQNKEKKGNDQTRSVKGGVTLPDDKTAVGAVVQLTNTKTLQVRSFVTQEDGQYYFHSLSTDVDYKLEATFKDRASGTEESSGSKTLSSFDSRKEAIINLKLSSKK